MSGPLDDYAAAPRPGRGATSPMPYATNSQLFDAMGTLQEDGRLDYEGRMLAREYAPVIAALGLPEGENPGYFAQGEGGRMTLHLRPSRLKHEREPGSWVSQADRPEQEELLFARIAQERRRRGANFLPGVPDTPAAFREWAVQRERERRGEARAVLDRSDGGVAAVASQAAGGALEWLNDPLHLATLPLGGWGRSLAMVALRSAATNALVTAGEQPIVATNRDLVGEELTLGEAAVNIGIGALAGSVLETGIAAAGRGTAKALRLGDYAPLDRQVAAALEAADLPDVRAAANVLEREAEVAATSPYAPGGPSLETHTERLAAAMAAIENAPPPPARAPIVAPDMPAPSSPRVPRGTSGGVDTLMQKIAQVESGGRTNAANPRSSASGLYQFTDGTFLRKYKQRYGSAERDFTILTRKNNPQLQAQLMRDLTAENAQALARAGEAETAGNLYLAHFAGSGGALKVLKAEADAPLESVLGQAAVAANPFMRGKTAGWLVDWAHRKMGQPGLGGERVVLARQAYPEGDAGEAMWRAVQAELDAETMSRVALRKAEDRPAGADGVARTPDDAGDAIPVRWEDQPAQAAEMVPDRSVAAAPDPAVIDLMPGIQRAIGRDGVSLDPARLAKRLDATEELARAALELAARAPGSGLTPGRNGGWRRAMRRREEPDIVTLIADGGGVRDEIGRSGTYGAHQMAERLKALVPGAGPLHRKTGKSLDEWGEALHELGWFQERPTTAEVLDLLERGVAAYGGGRAKRIYRPDARVEVRADIERSEGEQELVDRLADHLAEREISASDDFVERLAERFGISEGEDFAAAADRALAEEANAEIETAVREAVPAAMPDYDDPWGPELARQLEVLRHDLADADDGLPFMIDEARTATVAELLEEVDAEKAFAAALRGCL